MSRVRDAVTRFAASQPTALAVTGDQFDLTYAGLETAVAAASIWLRAELAGRPAGSPVALALDNGPAWAVLDLALIGLGRASVPLPPFFTPAQRAHALEDCGAGLLLHATEPGDAFGATVAGVSLSARPLETPPRDLHPGTAKITYTSGSTGRPKGVCLSLAQMETVAAAIVEAIGRADPGVHLSTAPLGVLLENVAGLYAILLAGGRYHVPSLATLGYAGGVQPDFARLVAEVVVNDVSSMILSPELLRALTERLTAERMRLPSLTLVAVGGAKVSPSLIAAARAAGLPAYEGYGLSECASVVALNTPGQDRPGTVGRPLPHVEVTIDASGEIHVGPSPFLGYVGGPPHAGPVATGDLGSIEPDGFLRISGRRSSLLVTAYGRNVAPEWVESELLAQPEIRQAFVYGDGRPQLRALVVAAGPDVPDAALSDAVARANAALPGYAQVGQWRRSPPFEARRGELTGAGRLRRSVLLDACQACITPES